MSSQIKIRPATLDDARAITEINISDVNAWVQLVGDKLERGEYEKISVEDRYLKGGPWMSIETCAIHLNYMLTTPGNYVYVAELNNRVVGEIEVILDKEPPPYGKHAYIYLLWIHKDARRKGIGKALVRYVEEKAISKYNVDRITTVPDENSIGFYKKLGFFEVERYITIKIRASSQIVNVSPTDLDCIEDLSDWYFVIGRFASSRSILFNMKCKYYFPKLQFKKYAFSCDISDGEALCIIATSKNCIVPCGFYCWIKTKKPVMSLVEECLRIASGLAQKIGIKELTSCIRNDFKTLGNKLDFIKLEKEFPFLMKLIDGSSR